MILMTPKLAQLLTLSWRDLYCLRLRLFALAVVQFGSLDDQLTDQDVLADWPTKQIFFHQIGG